MRVVLPHRAHARAAIVRAMLGLGGLVLAACGAKAPTAPTTPPPVVASPAPAVSYAMRGVVTAASGAAIPSAAVEVTAGANAGRTSGADAEGRYVLTALEPGTMTVRASASGFQSVTTSVAIDGDLTHDFTLPAPDSPPPPPEAPERATLTGIVRAGDPGGTPTSVIPGARLVIPSGPNGGQTTVTDAGGTYVFNDLTPGDAEVQVSARGYLPASRTVTLGAQSAADFTLDADPAFTTSGRVLDATNGAGLAGVTIDVDGLSETTSSADGAFIVRTDSPASEVRVATFRGSGVVDRRTGLKVPGPTATAPLIPADFDLAAFDQMMRTPELLRWTTDPPLRIEQRVLTISNVDAATGAATSQTLTAENVSVLQGDLTWALPQLTGGTFQGFAGVTLDLPAEGADVPLLNTGTITVAWVEGLTETTGYDGYGRWQYADGGVVTGGVILLDAAFERSGNSFARMLHAHELGHALGYQHVTLRASVMNPEARLEPTPFDLDACRIAFLRPPGNRSPDVDPDPSSTSINRWSSRRTWSAAIR